MMESPMISVVMSVFNGERHLAEAIESILDQSFKAFEFLIIDDGSSDGTPAILNDYRGRDSRIKVISQPNSGLVDALNRGCGAARGTYIARMDADDIAHRDRLQTQLKFMESHPEAGVVGSAVEFVDANGELLDIESSPPLSNAAIQAALLDRCVLWHPSVMIRRSLFAELGGYRKVPHAEDYDFWLRAAERSQLINLPTPLLRYRLHPGQVSSSNCRRQVLGALAARASARARRNGIPDPVDLNREITAERLVESGVSEKALHSAMAGAYLTWIRNMCQTGDYSVALELEKLSREYDYRHAERWMIADLHLWVARAHRGQKRFGMSLRSVVRAVVARPAILGRPLKPMLVGTQSHRRQRTSERKR